MEQHECARCGQKEKIGTHQFVIVEDKQEFLCRRCWEEFRYWFNRPEKKYGEGEKGK